MGNAKFRLWNFNVSNQTHMRFAPRAINGEISRKRNLCEIDDMLSRLDRMIYRYHSRDSIRCYQILNPRPIGYLHDWLPSYLLAGYQTRTDLYARDNETRRPHFRDGYRFVVPRCFLDGTWKMYCIREAWITVSLECSEFYGNNYEITLK